MNLKLIQGELHRLSVKKLDNYLYRLRGQDYKLLEEIEHMQFCLPANLLLNIVGIK